MLHSISGKLIFKKTNLAVIETAGLGFKLFISSRASKELPKIGSKIKLFSYLCVNQSGIEIYGFLNEKEREMFEMLDSINGVGPKAALKIMGEMKTENLLSAISGKRSDLLTKAAGIGSKKASRIILELSDKIKKQKIEDETNLMEANFDLEEILISLGYKKNETREVIKKIPSKTKTLQEKLKIAFKFLNPKNKF
ncbi:Holliday junction branch migration protein RuvA [Candidatus Wolfebacteria bacterium]|nr:Holliday junction branch migration protein RuvA [Candidatus Wolfebacteria bacterium]